MVWWRKFTLFNIYVTIDRLKGVLYTNDLSIPIKSEYSQEENKNKIDATEAKLSWLLFPKIV